MLRAAHDLAPAQSGNVVMVMGLALPVLLGIAGLGIEGAGWYNAKRSMQNAADAAALAAATNASTIYLSEAKAVTKDYGYTDGSSNVTVIGTNAASCPAGGSDCYRVTISKKVPLIFAPVVGFDGDTTVGSAKAITIVSTATAKKSLVPREYCILALGNGTGTSAIDFDSNGAPNANLTGCSVASNTSMTCSGSNLNADYGDAVGSNNNCGVVATSGIDPITDRWASLNSNIPSNTCSSYPGVTTWSGTVNLSGATKICGTLKLAGNVTLTGSGQIVIYNGNLDLFGYQMRSSAGAGVTLIFAGTNSASYPHTIVDSKSGFQGTLLDIAAPDSTSTSVWKGIAIYQATNLTQNVSMTFSGNEPQFNLTGVTYMPHADITLSGAINKSSNGYSCFALVSKSVRINGTANILSRGQCGQAGATAPTGSASGRASLVI